MIEELHERWCKGCDAVVLTLRESNRDAWACRGEHITTGLDAHRRWSETKSAQSPKELG